MDGKSGREGERVRGLKRRTSTTFECVKRPHDCSKERPSLCKGSLVIHFHSNARSTILTSHVLLYDVSIENLLYSFNVDESSDLLDEYSRYSSRNDRFAFIHIAQFFISNSSSDGLQNFFPLDLILWLFIATVELDFFTEKRCPIFTIFRSFLSLLGTNWENSRITSCKFFFRWNYFSISYLSVSLILFASPISFEAFFSRDDLKTRFWRHSFSFI